MSLELYDLALEKKLKNIFENVIMAPPDDAFARSNKEGKVRLPLISAYRMSNEVNWDEFNHPASFRGRPTRVEYREGFKNDDKGNPRYADVNWKHNPVNSPSMRRGLDTYRLTESVPIKITYQIDIWAQLRKYADEIFRELVFYLLHYPDLLVEIPSVQEPLVFSLQLTDTSTETDYEFGDTNVIHRYTLTYEVPFAQLFYEPDSVPPVLHIPTTYMVYNITDDDNPDIEHTQVDADPKYFELRHVQEEVTDKNEVDDEEIAEAEKSDELDEPDSNIFPRLYEINRRW